MHKLKKGPNKTDHGDAWHLANLLRVGYLPEVWLADLQQGKSLGNVQAGILSSSEFFERQRSNRDLYVAEVFRQLYGMPPSPAQLADLQARYDRVQGVRLQFVEQLLQQSR